MKVKAVLFDLFNTLVFSDVEGSRKSELRIVDLLRSFNPSVTVEDYRALRKKYHIGITTGKISWNVAHGFMLKDMGISNDHCREFNVVVQQSFIENIRVYDGVKDVLSKLKKNGLKLGLVTNCGDGTMEVLRYLGLDGFFDSFGFSYEVGVRKPDPEIYLKVTGKLGVEPEDCVFVADEIFEDLVGAGNLGMKTIYIKQKRRWGIFNVNPDKAVIKPDTSVDKFIDILDILEMWMSQ